MYTPTDASDYNAVLQTTDNTFMAMGNSMVNAGKTGTAIGAVVAATGGGIAVSSGGVAAVAGVSAVVTGVTLAGASTATRLVGALMQMNAANNSSKGYNKGKQKSNSGYNSTEAEHKKNARASTKGKHQKGLSRKNKDKGNEKGDVKRKRYK